MTVVVLIAQAPSARAPVASVWYRGQPAGVARAADLAAIRASGFAAVTWPLSNVEGAADLRRLADEAGLAVVIRAEARPLTAQTALAPSAAVDISAGRARPGAMSSLAWRAIAHGARVISFDAGLRSGTGVSDSSGAPAPWVAEAAHVAQDLRVNGGFIVEWRRAEPVVVDTPRPASFDVVLLEADKSWVVVATNPSATSVHAVAHLPARVPYAIWLNLIDGTTTAMLNEAQGPRWSLDLEPWTASVNIIDKTLK
jgi:hypothetical protein